MVYEDRNLILAEYPLAGAKHTGARVKNRQKAAGDDSDERPEQVDLRSS
jgi:hypothetical protein